MSDSTGLRLLAVHAHPDDEASKGAATMARYLSEGARVLVVTCTGGELGSVLNPALKDREAELLATMPSVRREEMAAAQRILGFEQTWLGFLDSGLPEAAEGETEPPPLAPDAFAMQPLEVAAAPLVAIVREFRPHVITTYDERGGYPHPDHIMTHRVSMEAWERAGDADSYPEAGEPWAPSKLYYHQSFTKERLTAMNDAMLAAGLESPYSEWLERWDERRDSGEPTEFGDTVTTRVACSEWFAVRDAALLAYATQVDPGGPWFRAPREVQAAAWPTEDYVLARARVPAEAPETDLFAGLRASVGATA